MSSQRSLSSPAADDVASAGRLAAAVSADDVPGWSAVIAEAIGRGRLVELLMAMTVRHVTICGEYYDTDRQAFLDMHAFDALQLCQGGTDDG